MLSVTCLIAWTMAARSFFFIPNDHPDRPSGPLGADILRVLGYFVEAFWWLIQPLIIKVISGFRYWFRYQEKKIQSLEYTRGFAMGAFLTNTKDLDDQNYDRKRCMLEVILNCYNPVLDSIMTELHYVDIVNLRQTSKMVRNALDASSHKTLRVASCISGTKSECWSCGIQICRVRNSCQHRPSS